MHRETSAIHTYTDRIFPSENDSHDSWMNWCTQHVFPLPASPTTIIFSR
jgi:hypothetical protein